MAERLHIMSSHLNRAAGVPELKGYVPSRYNGKILAAFYAACILPAIANTDYIGDIKGYGSEVIIRTRPNITVVDHNVGDTVLPEQPEPSTVTLQINKMKRWSFIANMEDQEQTDLKSFTDDWTEGAAENLQIAIDTDELAEWYLSAHAGNVGDKAGIKSGSFNLGVSGTPVAITPKNALDYLSHMASVLDEQNVPRKDGDRWVALPVWFTNCLARSSLRNANEMGDAKSVVRTGQDFLGVLDGFRIFRSNLLETVTDGSGKVCTHIMFGHRSAATFAAQITENEMLQNPWGFGKMFRGMTAYGTKVIRPEALGDLYAYHGSEA